MANPRPRPGTWRLLLLAPPSPGRAARFVTSAWVVALAGIWAGQRLHDGLHEHIDLPPAVHLARDGALAVPLAALSLALAGLLVGLLVARLDASPASVRGRLAWALTAAVLFALLSIPGGQLHGLLFGAEEEAGTSFLADLLLDSGVTFAASLIALTVLSLTPIAPWPPELAAGPAAVPPRSDPVGHPAGAPTR